MTVAKRMWHLGPNKSAGVLEHASELEAQGKEIIHLETEEPDFNTPRHIVEAGMQALKEGFTHYGPTAGLPELREAIARNNLGAWGGKANADNVVVTPGAKPMFLYVLLTLAEPGIEVIYPNPGDPDYESLIKFAGATPVPLQMLEENNYHPDLDALSGLINHNSRLLILNSPENPCGSALSEKELSAIADLVTQYPELYVLSDETYKDFLYDQYHHSISSIPGMQQRTIIVESFSKSYAMPGWRLGYGILPDELVPRVVKLANNHISCTATFTQMAGIAALDGPNNEYQKMLSEFSKRRQLITDGLRSIPGIDCNEPEGAIYAFPNITNTGMTSEEFQHRSVTEAGVALLSGASFGDFGEGYVRVSYATSQENLNKGIDRLTRFVRSAA